MVLTALCKDREACKQARVHAHRTRDSNCQSPEEKDGILKSIDPSSALKGTERYTFDFHTSLYMYVCILIWPEMLFF